MTKEDADIRYTPNKFFIGGIAAQTTTERMKTHFSKYGRIIDCVVMQKSGRPRGFGFVTFDNAAEVDQVISEPQMLDGRIVDVKRAVPEDRGGNGDKSSNKIFIGGLPQSITTEHLKQYFGRYGPISDAVVMLDKRTGRSRGFGFIRYVGGPKGTKAADEVLAHFYEHQMEGKWIEVKRATPLDLAGGASTPSPTNQAMPGRDHPKIDTSWAGQESIWSLAQATAPLEAAAASLRGVRAPPGGYPFMLGGRLTEENDFMSLLTQNKRPSKVASPSRRRNDAPPAPTLTEAYSNLFAGLPLEFGKMPDTTGALYPQNPMKAPWMTNVNNLENEANRANAGVDPNANMYGGGFGIFAPVAPLAPAPLRGGQPFPRDPFTREDFLSIDIGGRPSPLRR